MIMRLQHQRPDGEIDTYHLKPGRRYHIGRGSACEVRILDLKLSRKHCAVEFSDGSWQVIDLLSTNGCKLNGEQIVGTVPLVTGNAIEAGQTQLVVAEIVAGDSQPVAVRRAEDEDTTHSDGEQTRTDSPVVRGQLAESSDSDDDHAPVADHTETTRAPLEQGEMPEQEDDSRIEPAIDSSDFTPEPLAEALTKTASLIPHPGVRTPVVTAASAPAPIPAPVAPPRPLAPPAPRAPAAPAPVPAATAAAAPRRPAPTTVRPTAVFRADDQKIAPAAPAARATPAPMPHAAPGEDDYTGHGMPIISEDHDAALTVTPVAAPRPAAPAPVAMPATRPAAPQPGTGEERAYFITVLGRKIGPLSKAAARELKARELKGGLSHADLAGYPQP